MNKVEQNQINATYADSHMIEVKGGTVKKIFNYEEEDNFALLKNEVFWLNCLKSKWVPELLEVGNNYVITSYYGPDLTKVHPLRRPKDLANQTLEMYKFFKDKNVFKLNGALRNMTLNKGQLVAFDFKWARFRTNKYKNYEIFSYEKWLSKIDIELVEKLKLLI
jgi:hypothetical protein|tara:strand:- start:37 stop:528 length:492 start_codon:yes stop_codon:yes gene_type:complete